VSLHLNVPADPVNYNVVECVQYGLILQSNSVGRRFANVWHLARENAGGAPVLADLASNVATQLTTLMPPVLHTGYVSDGATIRPLDDPTVAALDVPDYWPDGAATGDRYADFGAWTMEIHTGLRGRCFRGRKHFGPVAEAQTTLDEIAAASTADFLAAVGAWEALTGLGDSGGNTWGLCVVSRKNSILTGPSIVLTWADFTACTLQPALGTMRHRKMKGDVI